MSRNSTTKGRRSRERVTRYADARPFDAAEYLVSEAQVAAYLDAALGEGDPAFFQEALGTVARARGMKRIADESATTRAGLYKALASQGNPEFATVQRVVNALGHRLQIAPVRKAVASKSRPAARISKKSVRGA